MNKTTLIAIAGTLVGLQSSVFAQNSAIDGLTGGTVPVSPGRPGTFPNLTPTVDVGYFTDFNEASTDPAAPIGLTGATAVHIPDIATVNLSLIDILMINEASNGGLSAAMSARLSDIATWVASGGCLVVHDRFVGPDGVPSSNPFLVGAAGTQVVRSLGTSIDVATPATMVVAGPHGALNDTSLDGGNFSAHGFAQLGTLPGGAVPILDNGNDAEIVAFSYSFGAGSVFYGTSPLDFYLTGAGNNPPGDDFRLVYAPNVLEYIGSVKTQPIPEPGTVFAGSILAGLIGTWAWRRARARA